MILGIHFNFSSSTGTFLQQYSAMTFNKRARLLKIISLIPGKNAEELDIFYLSKSLTL